jgi:hypothetical protein
MDRSDIPSADRLEFDFARTRCDCEICRIPCKHVPGSLVPSDLQRLCPEGQDLLAWAEEHLLALTERPVPTLVPRRQANGACHWFFEGKCAVHEVSPFGCAYFDSHMAAEEATRRRTAANDARKEDARRHGLYYRVWQHLIQKGKIGIPGDREGMREESRRLVQTIQRRWNQLAEPRQDEISFPT